MNKCEIIERLKNVAGYAVHTVGEEPFVMSLDDGIAVHEAIELLKKPETNCSEIPNNSDTISRQAVIDLLKQMRKDGDMVPWEGKNVFARIRKLPPVQPETCKGCKHFGKWENEVEYGYPSPCTCCKRRAEDHYER